MGKSDRYEFTFVFSMIELIWLVATLTDGV